VLQGFFCEPVTLALFQTYKKVEDGQIVAHSVSFYLFRGRKKTMLEKNRRSGSGSKAIAVDNRVQMAKIRLLLFLSILISASMALALTILLGR